MLTHRQASGFPHDRFYDWGAEVRRVELKNLTPSIEIQEAMEQQKKSSIKKDAEILEAEGHKQADVLKFDGHKASTILNAEAEKQKKIVEAEAEEQSRIHKARGEAEGIKSLKQAEPIQEVLLTAETLLQKALQLHLVLQIIKVL